MGYFRMTEDIVPGMSLFSQLCFVAIGNQSHNNMSHFVEELEYYNLPTNCVFHIDSYDKLTTVVDSIGAILDQDKCICPGEETYKCSGEGAPCENNGECASLTMKCVSGTCQPRTCAVRSHDEILNCDEVDNCYYYDYFDYYDYYDYYSHKNLDKSTNDKKANLGSKVVSASKASQRTIFGKGNEKKTSKKKPEIKPGRYS